MSPEHRRPTGGRYSEALQSQSFRRIWYSQLLSELGDAAGRIALAVLVTIEMGNALGAGVVLAVSALPYLGPGQIITAWCERLPRRSVLVASDLVRAGCYVAIVLPMPVALRFVLLALASLASPPFDAVRNALVPATVPPHSLVDALSLQTLTNEATRLLGLAIGGLVAALVGPEIALLANATTFLLSAVLLVGLPVGNERSTGTNATTTAVLRASARFLRTDPLARRVVLLYPALVTFASLPETLAVPFAATEFPGTSAVAGLLAATVSASILVVAPLVRPPRTDRLLFTQAMDLALIGSVLAGALLLAPGGAAPVFGAFAAVGLILVCRVNLCAALSKQLPDDLRATGFSVLDGVTSFGLVVCGLGGGALADAIGEREAFVVFLCIAAAVALVGRLTRPGEDRAPVSSAAPG